jgi:hypothetical protein
VRDLTLDSWTTKGSHLRAGERAVIWKAKGRGKTRGIIALAEILTDPALSNDLFGSQYAIPPITAAELIQVPPELHVTVRYLDAPGLPLWVGGARDRSLAHPQAVRCSRRHRLPRRSWTMGGGDGCGGWLALRRDRGCAKRDCCARREEDTRARLSERSRSPTDCRALRDAARHHPLPGTALARRGCVDAGVL